MHLEDVPEIPTVHDRDQDVKSHSKYNILSLRIPKEVLQEDTCLTECLHTEKSGAEARLSSLEAG